MNDEDKIYKWYTLTQSPDWDVIEKRVEELEKKNADAILKLSRTPSIDAGITSQCIASQTEALKSLLRYARNMASKVKKGD